MTIPHPCPECGAETTLDTCNTTSAIPFGEVTWQKSVLRCSACEHQVPLETEDAVLDAAIEKARADSVLKMLAKLKEQGVSMAQLERALGLAPRTTHHWKSGKLSSSVLALLRILATYPWLVELARLDFDPDVADSALLQAAENLLTSHGLTIEIKSPQTSAFVDNVVQLYPGGTVRPTENRVKIG